MRTRLLLSVSSSSSSSASASLLNSQCKNVNYRGAATWKSIPTVPSISLSSEVLHQNLTIRTGATFYTTQQRYLHNRSSEYGRRHFKLSATTNISSTVSSSSANTVLPSGADFFSTTTNMVDVENETSTITASNTESSLAAFDPRNASGEELFHQYLITSKRLEQLKIEHEKAKSEKMFEAWKRTSKTSENDLDHSNNNVLKKKNNAGGVAVVRTLAREVAKNRENDPIQKLEKRAYHLLQIAAIKHKHPKALIALANMEMAKFADEYSNASSNNQEITPLGLMEKLSPILKFYDLAAEAGEAEAYYNLAHIYWDGIEGIIASDHDTALSYMEKAIHLGDIDAMYFVGEHRLQNKHLYRIDQLQKAIIWIETAADRGHGSALYSLALLHMKGFTELQIPVCSNEEFQRRIASAIENDDCGDAYFLRATTYHDGTFGNPIDIRLWFEDMVKAAELGHATACLYVGVLLFKGHPNANIEQDQARAFQYYQRAGELGNIEGWRCVVDCYLTGQGVQQNIEMAKYIGETMVRPYDEASTAVANNDNNTTTMATDDREMR